MKNSEIVELSTEDLTARLVEEKAALNKLKFAHAVSAIENPNVIKAARRTIARISTEISKRTNAAKSETASEA
ncbi:MULTISPECIES: 50S ribosomal protein L29 [Sphingobacterium]|uniref:Large ribosomal subunit protein uL29 n=1 Tax=Sphingobacterium cellulitidis TaxID=1768011 RepID=A0A8H9KWH9_9SPHI|nr:MULTISPECIES: 50S ribosomal protein L29 [Sphingobacterium]MBA8987988.1 large subunit ribosomal protein L29 [Sphingobacterium soli]OYD41373.1 50S ribosomal protein L29 [Sphingobacterium cellulitidis]OYD45865.1 50S ribosomal protein L29 [Sphingobacterium cellulitidis]WFB62939.1 50S ribosomal protein L29 [Sphingobacterium sp. WM]GGE26400.1 50S ribosomal protein L29 [Sphingobacterium soli]